MMRQVLTGLAVGLAVWAIGLPAAAETVACPDPAQAIQVGACPAEEDLRIGFGGYCSDNARLYDKADKQLCTDYGLYRAAKNIALWETPDGRFSGYVSCEPGRAGLAGAVVKGLRIDKQGSVTRLSCQYNTGLALSHRTKSACTADAAACAADPAACAARCE